MDRRITRPASCFLLLCALLRAGAAGAEPLPADAPRIVSLSPQTTAALLHLDHGAHLIGIDPESRALFGLDDIIGSGDARDAETLLAAGPTLVVGVAGKKKRQPLHEALRNAGVSVRLFEACTVHDVFSLYRSIGDLLGVPAAAESLVRSVSRDLARISGATYGLPRPAVVVITGTHRARLAAGIGLVGDMIESGGGEHALELAGPPCSSLEPRPLEPLVPAVLLDARPVSIDLASMNRTLSGGTARGVPIAGFMDLLHKLELPAAAALVRARLYPDRADFQP